MQTTSGSHRLLMPSHGIFDALHGRPRSPVNAADHVGAARAASRAQAQRGCARSGAGSRRGGSARRWSRRAPQHDNRAGGRAGARNRHPPSAAAAGAADLVVEPPAGSAGPGRRRAGAAARSAAHTSRSSSARLAPRFVQRESGRPLPRPARWPPVSTRSMNRLASRSQPGSSTVSAWRNSSQGKRALAAPRSELAAAPSTARSTTAAPASSAMSTRPVAGAAVDHDRLAHQPIDGRRHQRDRVAPGSPRHSRSE